jgi:hypothetical protein
MQSESLPALTVTLDTSLIEKAAFDFRGQLFQSLTHACAKSGGEFVMLFMDKVRIRATRDASFVVQVSYDPDTSEPNELADLELVGDPRVVLSLDDDDFEVIEHWSEKHTE